ncbi:hypothetical protein SAMN02799625_04668 [Methylobacterium sp. UNC300MFChir4.1]|uniref:hypothetical protein n=1 Tax=Methylobacterium sp. UNC300MFChir4.1 TaxID=1502747 RepID=UPI0008AF6B9A|nr:hypothetical protein [Methylobacterium sp. UNC300MFChir4.1]SEP09823.1 hypothetical protein SAMN02799625_04668 [Methylobacterium sp. UNC300MFChir4.1]
MAGGVAFDPAEFAAFKSGLAASGGARDAGPAPAAVPVADAFDPAEFASFKASRQAPASFADRFDVAPPMSRAEAAPRVDASGTGGPSIAQDQKAADALYGGMRRTADEELIGKPSAGNTALAALFGAGQGASLNIAGNAAAGVATGLGMLEGAGVPGISGYGDGKRTFAENYDRFRDLQGAYERQNPKTAVASELVGAVAATPLMPGLPVAEGANIAARATRYGLTGAGYGGAAAAIGSHDPVKTLEGAGYGAAGGAILGPIVEKVAPPVIAATSKALEPILARFGRGAVATETGFTPRARAVLINAGLDADRLPPELAQHIETTFAAKGETPAALREAQAAEFGLPLSRGQATQDPRALAEEGRALAGQSGPRAQAIGEEFGTRQADALAGARDRFQGMAAGSFDRIENPQAAYEAVADRARQAAQAEAERASVAQRGLDDALRAVRERGGTDALDGASAAAQGVRDAAAQGRAGYRAAYDEVAQIPGTFAPGALDRLGSRVRDRLGADVPLNPVLTPAATRAISDLDALPGLFNLQPGEGPSLQQLDQVRKRLVAYRGTTGQNPTDRRAVDRIIAELDNHAQDAMSVGLFGQQAGGRAADVAGDGFPRVRGAVRRWRGCYAHGRARDADAVPRPRGRRAARCRGARSGFPPHLHPRAGDARPQRGAVLGPNQGSACRRGLPTAGHGWRRLRARRGGLGAQRDPGRAHWRTARRADGRGGWHRCAPGRWRSCGRECRLCRAGRPLPATGGR